MRVYFIGQKGVPSTGGGVEKHVEELTARLAKSGWEVFVYTRRNYTDRNLKEWRGVRLISLPSIPTKHLDAISHTFFACLDLIFRQKDADLVHFHAIGPSSLIWLIKIFRPALPVVATFHCQDYFHRKWGFFARLYLRFGEAICCKGADEVISVSRALKRYTMSAYDRESKYIPNGVAKPMVKKADKIERRGLKKGNYIFAASRLIRHKGIHYLIEAYNNLDTDKKLVIAGDGAWTDDYVKELKKLAEKNKNIIFTGRQTGDVLAELFSNAFLFVQPSDFEGMSIALLEAMSYGLPILSSDITENKEALYNTGFFFKRGNVEDLANKMAFILKNPALAKKKAIEAEARVKKFYNWNDIARETSKFYCVALEAKKSFLASLITSRN